MSSLKQKGVDEMISGFPSIIPEFKRILYPSEYSSIWVMPITVPLVLIIYLLFLPRIIKSKIKRRVRK